MNINNDNNNRIKVEFNDYGEKYLVTFTNSGERTIW